MNTDDHILIQNFLKDQLSKEEKKEVISRIENDIDFQRKFNFERQLYLNLNDNEWCISKNNDLPEVSEYEKLFASEPTQKLKNTLKDVNSNYQLKNQRKRKTLRLLYSGVAVIIILIGLTIFLPRSMSSPQDLYASYLDVSDLPSLIDRGTTDSQLIKAQKLFEAKKYTQVLNIITNNFSDYQNNKAILYLYIGISQMELNQFKDAEKTFNTLINSEFIDAPKGKWYKALLFVKMNEISKAKKLLSEIIESPKSYKYNEAAELLNSL